MVYQSSVDQYIKSSVWKSSVIKSRHNHKVMKQTVQTNHSTVSQPARQLQIQSRRTVVIHSVHVFFKNHFTDLFAYTGLQKNVIHCFFTPTWFIHLNRVEPVTVEADTVSFAVHWCKCLQKNSFLIVVSIWSSSSLVEGSFLSISFCIFSV